MTGYRWRPERRGGTARRLLRAAVLILCADPSFAGDDASAEGIARIVAAIRANAERIERLDFAFRAPGFPRDDIQRSQLIRENQGLLRRAETEARTLLEPMRDEPPPGQWAWWHLLRDTESGARSARLLGHHDFRDQTIARRFAARQPPRADRPAEAK